MADHYSSCLIGVMDRLWFHQIILFSETSSTTLLPKTLKHHNPSLITSSLLTFPSSTLSFSTLTQEEESTLSPASSSSLEEITLEVHLNAKKDKKDDDVEVVNEKKRPARFNLPTSRARSHSSSPSAAKRLRRDHVGLRKVLQKSMSCRSLRDLELEEVKGFMDLGFIFKKEEISPRMISVVPGLLRLGLYSETKQVPEDQDSVNINDNIVRHSTYEQEQVKEIIRRPYLSEAWLIRRPNSPLLNLRLPRVSAAADMKKHLKFWARTVASEIQQES